MWGNWQQQRQPRGAGGTIRPIRPSTAGQVRAPQPAAKPASASVARWANGPAPREAGAAGQGTTPRATIRPIRPVKQESTVAAAKPALAAGKAPAPAVRPPAARPARPGLVVANSENSQNGQKGQVGVKRPLEEASPGAVQASGSEEVVAPTPKVEAPTPKQKGTVAAAKPGLVAGKAPAPAVRPPASRSARPNSENIQKGQNGQVGVKRPLEEATPRAVQASGSQEVDVTAPKQDGTVAAAKPGLMAGKAPTPAVRPPAKVTRTMAGRKPGFPAIPQSQRKRRPLDDEEVLDQEDGEGTLAALVDGWGGTVLSIADIAVRETDATIAGIIADTQAIASSQFDEDLISKIVRDSGYRLTMLIENSRTVTGYTVYSYDESAIEVAQIAIAEAHRGRGLGRCAVKWLLEHAKKAGLESLLVGCWQEGICFYETCGFKEASRTSDGYVTMCLDVEAVDSLPMVKSEKAAPKATDAPAAPAPKESSTPAKGQTATAKGTTVPPKGKTVPPKGRAQPPPKKGCAVSMSRGALVMKIFELCDSGGEKCLKQQEMLAFATAGGFSGTTQEWTKEFKTLCGKCGTDPAKGLDLVRFEQVINDGGAGTYTDEELQTIFAKLEEGAKAKQAEADMAIRKELIKKVFEACDADKDEALSEREMKQVVVHIGFTGSDEEWRREYTNMCLDNRRDPALGINYQIFEKLVSDCTDTGCYCSNKDLEAVLSRKAREPKTVKPPPRRSSTSSREGVILSLFKALDRDGDGHLNRKEMQNFASLIGFKCDEEKWAKEYALFCEQGEADPGKGIQEKLFVKLVDDRSDAGCYCSDGELKDMLKELNPNAGELSSRSSLISRAFGACDQDGDGLLSSEEMRTFAGYTGFDGDTGAWDREFKMLCSEVQANPAEGVNMAAFTKLVDDTSERGCYCRNAELATILRQMNPSTSFGEGHEGAAGGGTSMSLAPVSRAAIIRTVFHLCDEDGDKLLNEKEMRMFAVTAGFQGTQEEWASEYRFVCSRTSTESGKGVNPAKFIQVINNGGVGQYTDRELKTILEKLELQASLQAGVSGRSGVVRAVFHACDLDSDGYLNRQELKSIAMHVGFKGTNEEWAQEYKQMCIDHGVELSVGVDLVMFEELVNDSSESGCYCSDQDLRAVLQSMGETEGDTVKANYKLKDTPRVDLIRQVFRACDLDRDGMLDEREMRAFAHHVGFDGSPEEWAREYSLLCAEKKSQGIDQKLFEKLVNDNSESGCHCTDQQLSMILTKLNLGFR